MVQIVLLVHLMYVYKSVKFSMLVKQNRRPENISKNNYLLISSTYNHLYTYILKISQLDLFVVKIHQKSLFRQWPPTCLDLSSHIFPVLSSTSLPPRFLLQPHCSTMCSSNISQLSFPRTFALSSLSLESSVPRQPHGLFPHILGKIA